MNFHFSRRKYYSKELQTELSKELIAKSKEAAAGFFMAALWIIWTKFESAEYVTPITILGLSIMLLAVFRLIVRNLNQRDLLSLELATQLTILCILLNGIAWSAALFLPTFEFHFTNATSAVGVMSLLIALVVSSMVTISYVLTVALVLQSIIIVPTLGFLFYLWLSEGNQTGLHGSAMLAIVLIYTFRQTCNIHSENVRRFSYALDLEYSNKLLIESQDLLIQEKAKLQHSIKLAAVGEISAEIAHEINNPLGIMMGYIELSLDLLKSNSPDKEVLQVQLIKARSAISRITKIIKGLRHYSRRTNDDPLVPVFVNEIIEDAIEFCSEKFNYNKTILVIENPNDFKLLCRPIEISQVLLNIFSNGIDEVSKLDPELRKLKVQVISTGEHVRISISNFGPKIKPEVQEKLFEPFFSTKKIGIGTGLGLSISRGIIESYKGRLFYDPLPEQTTFVIELPQHISS